MMFYLINVANVANVASMSQPGACIGGGLHAVIHIFFLHGGSKSAKPYWDLKNKKFTSLPLPTLNRPNCL